MDDFRRRAVGSSLAGVLWQRGGWFGVSAGGIALVVVALIIWGTQRGTLALTRAA